MSSTFRKTFQNPTFSMSSTPTPPPVPEVPPPPPAVSNVSDSLRTTTSAFINSLPKSRALFGDGATVAAVPTGTTATTAATTAAAGAAKVVTGKPRVFTPINYSSYLYYGSLTLFTLGVIAGLTVLIVFIVKKKKDAQRKRDGFNNFKRALVENSLTEENKLLNELPVPTPDQASPEQTQAPPQVEAPPIVEVKALEPLQSSQPLPEPPVTVPVVEEVVQELKEEFELVKDVDDKEYDDPSNKAKEFDVKSVFPSLASSDDTSEEATFAKQYSYENLQDSMFTRQKLKPMKKMQSPTWEMDVQNIKDEIEKSGQSLDDFMKSTNAPLSEAFADAWKTASVSKPKPKDAFNLPVPKYAQKEMPGLVSDSTLFIPLDGKSVAFTAMEEILKARKRAKVLGVTLPPASQAQRQALEKWSSSDEKSLKDLATSLKTML